MQFFDRGWVGILIGSVIAFGFYLLGRRRAVPAFQQRGEVLLGHENPEIPEEVQVHYRGRPIPRLTKTTVVFWNAGERTLSGADVVQVDPLRIDVEGEDEILSCSVTRISRGVTGLHAEIGLGGTSVHLTFDFLDSQDGAIIELLHTCSTHRVRVEGTVRGIPGGVRNYGSHLTRATFRSVGPVYLLLKEPVAWCVLAASVVALVASLSMPTPTSLIGTITQLFLPLLGLVYAALAATMLYRIRRSPPTNLQREPIDRQTGTRKTAVSG